MTKASRSSKKQPAFDPSELEDLIFSPAVGKGVGSHLVTPIPALVEPELLPPTAIASSDLTTVPTPAFRLHESSLINPGKMAAPSTVATLDPTTVVNTLLSTVATSTSLPQKQRAPVWITDHGDLVSQARVKRIRLAQDVINSAEESVYDTLWNSKPIQPEISERDSSRLVQAGYDSLVKRTRLSRKTIQRIIARLLEKDFIAVETRADIYQRSPTVYRVFSYKAVLEQNARKGRFYVAKMGPGFSYVTPIDDPRSDMGTDLTTVDNIDMATVVVSDRNTVSNGGMTTVVNSHMATVVDMPTVTMDKNDLSTVVKMSSHLIEEKILDIASSTPKTIRETLGQYAPTDDDVAARLWEACRQEAPDCTPEEVVHFIHDKGALVRAREGKIYNPVGFLVSTVPKCFSGEAFRSFRQSRWSVLEAEMAQEKNRAAELIGWRREQEARLLDPKVSDREKQIIQSCLKLEDGE